ncbi:pickpocket protein 28-like [Bombyx mandarina]|uniref:Pickpocket protein 28-like n=1 Tax=Bombyx mandarina TaxID=7092 RepID=A0A6J2JMP6_BOMMA|nr:pickpocket protein 28-like [Bombyx mandarina]
MSIVSGDGNRVNHTSVPSVIKSLWSISPGDPKYDYYVRFVETVASSDIFNLDGFQEFAGDDQLDVDLTRLAVDVLPEVAIKPITSEDARTALFKWTRVITEAGVCYSTNSLGIADVAVTVSDSNVTLNYPIGCKYSSQICYVMFEVAEPIDFYVHSPYDIVDVASQASRVYPSLSRRSELTVMETRCAKGVRELAPRRRGCLFIDEPTDDRKKIYSANTCRLSCRSKRAVELCGCRPFYYVNEEGPVCSVAGMACLSGHSHLLSSTGAKCSCTPQCLDMVYREITVKDTKWEHGPFVTRGSIRYILQAPRTRYNREIVFYLQDLIVSLGGATGLFLGASFISFVEIIYFVIERIFKSLFEDSSTKNNVVTVKKSNPYEADRVIELTRVLDVQKKYPLKLN